MEGHSIFAPYGYSSESCGYCKGAHSSQRTPRSRTSFYAQASCMTVEHYQSLVDRGWRRSGTILYLPDQKRACCPHYTIRLPVSSFTPSRDQRKAINRWNRFVLGEGFLHHKKLKYKSKADKAKQRNEFHLLEAVHASESSIAHESPEDNQAAADGPDHEFVVSLEATDFTEEKYKLFEHYQRTVHKEDSSQISRNGFKRFLCQSPLVKETQEVDCKPKRLGSFHHCYRLDGRLIAMAVLDLLPHAVSAVYFIYHQEFEKFSFGKLSAVREAAMALEGGFKYYYMGYYIHSCAKMRYKCDYKPQYVLDPESHDWDPLDDAMKAKLDEHKYVSLSRDRAGAQQPEVGKLSISSASQAADAVASGLSIFDLEIPGAMSASEVEDQVDLDAIIISITRQNIMVPAGRLFALTEGSIRDPTSAKGVIAQFVACVGPDVTSKMIIEL